MTFKKLIIIIVVFYSSMIYAQGALLNEIKQNIEKNYRDLETLEIEFVQTNFFKDFGQTIVTEGKLYFMDNKVLLEYKGKQNQLLLIDGDTVYIMDTDQNQMIISDRDPEMPSVVPNEVIDYYWARSDLVLTQKENVVITFYTKSDPQTKQIDVTLHTETYRIKKIEYHSHDGNIISFKIVNENINHSLDISIFDLPVNEETTVIEAR